MNTRLLIVLALLFPLVLLAEDRSMRNTLGTRVTATPEAIVLDWDPKHPWSAAISRGASLIARYDTATQGIVLQILAPGKPDGVSRMNFILPSALTVPPTGPVCLFIRLSDKRILPIRKPGSDHGDPSLFRDRFWEDAAASRTGVAEQRRFVSEVQAAAARADQQVAQARAALEKKGWTEAAGCQNIAAPTFAENRPFDVLPVEQQSEAARRACVTRALLGEFVVHQDIKELNDSKALDKDFAENVSGFVMSPTLLEFLIKKASLRAADLGADGRQQQLTAFERDWTKYSTDPDVKQPVLGDERDRIELQSITSEYGSNLIPAMSSYFTGDADAKAAADPNAVKGFVGGQLEAYSRCVVDSQRQLLAKLKEWQVNQANAPRLSQMAHDELVASCRKDESALSALVAQQQALHARLQQQEGSVRPPSSDNTSSSGAPTQILNEVECSVSGTDEGVDVRAHDRLSSNNR